jgi:hypothetical protein
MEAEENYYKRKKSKSRRNRKMVCLKNYKDAKSLNIPFTFLKKPLRIELIKD